MTTSFRHRNGFTFLESIVVMFSIILLVTIVGPGLFRKEKVKESPLKGTPELGSPAIPKAAPAPAPAPAPVVEEETPATEPDLSR